MKNFRSQTGSVINEKEVIKFSFDSKIYFGYGGDTLSSALLANGVHLIGRSLKHHIPRGFFGEVVDEPYAVVQLHRTNETEPNVKATEHEFF